VVADTATRDSPLTGAQRTAWRFDGFVAAVAVDAGSRTAAFALGSGKLRLVDFAKQQAHAARTATAHDGAVLALVADADGFVSGGDDGKVMRVAREGAASELARWARPGSPPQSDAPSTCYATAPRALSDPTPARCRGSPASARASRSRTTTASPCGTRAPRTAPSPSGSSGRAPT
jgi:hypothetical protein